MIDDLSVHLNAAYDKLEDGRNQAAAREIRSAAEYLKEENGNVSGEDQASLLTATRGLIGLATWVAQGKVTSPLQLDKVFAKAYQAHEGQTWIREPWHGLVDLPEYHFRLARDALIAGLSEKAAVELRKTAALMRLQAARAAGRGKTALAGSSEALKELADKGK